MNQTVTVNKVRKIIAAYVGIVSTMIVPLYMRNGYFYLIHAKAEAYLYSMLPAIAAMAVVFLNSCLTGKAKTEKSPEQRRAGRRFGPERVDPGVIILSVIGLWSLISTCLSYNPRLSFMGTMGWSVGSLMTIVLIGGSIIIHKYFDYKSNMMIPVIIVNLLIFLIAVLQSAGIDVLDLWRGLDKKEYFAYISTIGQKNSFSGYLCLILPLIWGFFAACKDRKSEILYGIISLMGFMCVVFAESDSTYAGIGICLIFMIPFAFLSEKHFKKSALMLSMHGCCLLIAGYFPVFYEKTKRYKGISKLMLKRPLAGAICVTGMVLYFVGWKALQKDTKRRRRIAVIILELVIIGAICAMIVHNVQIFDDNWGTKRGMAWKTAWGAFRNFSLERKLVGVGPEMQAVVFHTIRKKTGRNFVTAHCEPLQVLISQGIVGIILYMVFWTYLLYLYWKRKLWTKNEAVFFFPLAAYWGQSIFCSVYPVTAALFSVLSGAYLNVCKSTEN